MSRFAMGRICAGLGLTAAVLAAGCNPRPTPPSSGRMKVVATIYPLYDWVRQIGGDAVDAAVLVQPGVSPHTFEPTPSTAMQVSQAEVVVALGLGLDDWIARVAGDRARVVRLGATPGLALLEQDQGVNPHVWLDPQRAAVMVGALQKALAAADPAHADRYSANARAYRAQLGILTHKIKARTKPYRGREVLTFHAAFDYLLARCGIGVAAAIEPFPGKEPSARYLQALTATARRLGQRVIFAEPQLSDKAARVIADEIGGKVVLLDPLGDPDDARRSTYTALVEYDVEQIVRALSWESPQAGGKR